MCRFVVIRIGLAGVLTIASLFTLALPGEASGCASGTASVIETIVETNGAPVTLSSAAGAVLVTPEDGDAQVTLTSTPACLPVLDSGTPAIRATGGGPVTLAQSDWPSGIVLDAVGPVTVVGAQHSPGRFVLKGANTHIEAAIHAAGVVVESAGPLTVDAVISSPGGQVSLCAGLLMIGAPVSADGESGGSVGIAANRVLQWQPVTARGSAGPGGRIDVRIDEPYIQTVSGGFDVSGTSGGRISVSSGPDGRFYSSAALSALGSTGAGGVVDLTGNTVVLSAAHVDASGETQGGLIRIGAGSRSTEITPAALISADARVSGDGGLVELAGLDELLPHGTITARGGATAGDGGRVAMLTPGKLSSPGNIDVTAPGGKAGSVLADPKNLVVSAAGIYPQYDFINPNPHTGDKFGSALIPLSTGNLVVRSPFDDFGATDAGAVYLFDGLTGALKSTLVGGTDSDLVDAGVTALTNGNYVISISGWNNGPNANVGAVTFGSGTTGVNGAISASNSLIGSQAADQVGSGVTALTNGNYVVRSPNWDNGPATDAGAVTWGNGNGGTTGVVTTTNSLVGTQASDQIGVGGVITLTNGNYVVNSYYWDNGGVHDAGAVTWGNGLGGTVGEVSASNSLVGTFTNDLVGAGSGGVTALTNGNFVVRSGVWSGGGPASAGAATWGNGTGGTVGPVSAANSLVGSTANDAVSSSGVTALSNGNYVVRSQNWNNGGAIRAGAVTWGDGANGTIGTVSVANSLVGSTSNDLVGNYVVAALASGNYVVRSPNWHNGAAANAGAVTWGYGTSGTIGAVASSNSIVGTQSADLVGSGSVTELANGNFVISSPNWTNGANGNAGAVTWASGASGITGELNSTNSLVGLQVADQVGTNGIRPLTNGNYVVSSQYWDNGTVVNAGAATWGNGATGITGIVSTSNSLVGSTANDFVGSAVALSNGNYVIVSHNWSNGGITQAGAATWGNGVSGTTGAVSSTNSLVGAVPNAYVGYEGRVRALSNGNYVVNARTVTDALANPGAITLGNGTTGSVGVVSPTNSLVGTTSQDDVGDDGAIPLPNGNFVVKSANWDNGVLANAGAVTFGNGLDGITGTVTVANSLIGTAASTGLQAIVLDPVNGTFLARFRDEGAGRVTAGLQNPNQLSFKRAAPNSMTLLPSFLEETLRAGTAVTVEASNDVTFGSPIAPVNPAGDAGRLAVRAGRSVLLNESISTDNGSLTVLANEPLSSGVVDAQRDAGNADLTIAAGKTINAGTGAVTLRLGDGAGNTNRGVGTLTLGGITASSVTISSAGGATLPSGITIQSVLNISTVTGLTLQSGSTLGGTGSISGPLTVQSGATLSPGRSPGTLAVQGNLDLQAGSTLNVELSGTISDKLVVTGAVTLGGTLNLSMLSAVPPGTSFTIIDNDGTDAVVGTFAGLAEGATVTVNGQNFMLTYKGGDGNDVALSPPASPTPEPPPTNPAGQTVYLPIGLSQYQGSW